MIKFWIPSKPYGEFSNFTVSPFKDEKGRTWKTVEHYFQAHKFTEDGPWFNHIRDLSTAKAAAAVGRMKSSDHPDFEKIRKDWESVKEFIMMDALTLKFNSSKPLQDLLLSTGTQVIVEDSPFDYYWGIGKDGSGKNRLGKLLMQLREEYRCAAITTTE